MPFDGLSERLPTKDEAEKAKAATAAIAKTAGRDGALSIRLKNGDDEAVVKLPPAVSKILLDLLMLISKGEAVTLVPFGAELSTQKAADILNVSRPHLVKLIETDVIPCHRVGRHRRIHAKDLFTYKKQRDAKRMEMLDKLAKLGQEFEAG